MVKAVVFDVDGVVLNSTDENGKYLWSKNIKEDLGLTKKHFEYIYSSEWDMVTRGKKDTKEYLAEVFNNSIFDDLRITPEIYLNYWLSHDKFPNQEILDYVKTITLPCYLGTNQDEFRTKHILKLVNGLFDSCFSSYEIGAIKPEESYYQYIENNLSLLPEEILLIDDTKVNVDAALKRGWQAYLYKQDLNDVKSKFTSL